MKENVDLTQNKIFSNSRMGFEGIKALSLLGLEERILWREIGKIQPYDKQDIHDVWFNWDTQLIFTGDQVERHKKNENIHYDDGTYCDRCGTKLSVKPWDKHYGLCGRCALDLSYEIECDWRFKVPDLWNETEDRVVIEMNK